nr:tripartite tricarboxylate transporter substrate-binding protein [Hydrogenophaga palleronii]
MKSSPSTARCRYLKAAFPTGVEASFRAFAQQFPRAPSRPDGYTMVVGNIGPLAIAQAVRDDVPYDVFRDFSFVGSACLIEMVLVIRPGLNITTFEQMLAHTKANPGKLSYTVSRGLGTFIHLQMASLKALAGMNIVAVPYKGEVPAVTDMLCGHVAIGLISTSLAASYVKSSKLNVLVLPALSRSSLLPDVPPNSEMKAGVGFKAHSWSVFLAPAAKPALRKTCWTPSSPLRRASATSGAMRGRQATWCFWTNAPRCTGAPRGRGGDPRLMFRTTTSAIEADGLDNVRPLPAKEPA